MTLPDAKNLFAHYMKKMREGQELSDFQKRQLTRARQTLRKHAKPAMNAKHARDPRTGKLVITDKTDKYWFDKGFNDALLKIKPRNKKAHYLYGHREGKHYAAQVEKFNKEHGFSNRNAGARKRVYSHEAGKRLCECADSGCPVHKGKGYCVHPRVTTVYRTDMEDRTGTDMCAACAQDALESGFFTNPKVVRRNVTTRTKGARKIYGRCLRIEAVKTTDHTYGGKKTAAGQRYYHDFTTKNAKIYGLPNGDLLISTR